MAGPLSVQALANQGSFYVSQAFAGHLGRIELSAAVLGTSILNVTGFAALAGLASAMETLCGQASGCHLALMTCAGCLSHVPVHAAIDNVDDVCLLSGTCPLVSEPVLWHSPCLVSAVAILDVINVAALAGLLDVSDDSSSRIESPLPASPDSPWSRRLPGGTLRSQMRESRQPEQETPHPLTSNLDRP